MKVQRAVSAGLVCFFLLSAGVTTMPSNYAGRLYIDKIEVDVALYRSNKQSVVDRQDSAAYFDLDAWPDHMLIADHVTQSFNRLNEIEPGDTAYIVTRDGLVETYICVDAFDGHNTGQFITDWDGNSVMNDAGLLMYTCLTYWRNVRVTLWEPVPATTTDLAEGGKADGMRSEARY